jgi:ribosomal protein S18 acetylase RimI-like enzyme
MSALIRRYEEKDYDAVREIFFESSSKKVFNDEAEKMAFLEKYLGYYLRTYPEFIYVSATDRILGYVIASPQSTSHELLGLQPHLNIFKEHTFKYPAHLHINCHRDSRGMGIGSKLILEIQKELQLFKIIGLHIMTSPESTNRSFYKKLGFDFEVVESFNGSPILFMGKNLRMNKI